ncbi:MAG: histone [Candidatus Aenigmarchaeota archaeon ex4484_56]|nr:MAG: histone [Candidatus Aenigmarchaeota archaeon ex4484_56]
MFRKKKDGKIPLNTILKLSKEYGAERISKKAAYLISEILTSEFEKVIKEANKLAKHAKRKTIMEEDILLAVEKIR